MIEIVVVALIILIDQLSKYVVLQRLANGGSVRVGSLLRIRVAPKRDGGNLRRRYFGYAILLGFIISVLAYISCVTHLFENDLAQVGLGAAIGGAVSNMFDRFFRLRVVDFIDLGVWPAFNFADMAIVFGVALTLWYTF